MASNPQTVDQEDRKKIGMNSRSLIILVLLLPIVSLGKERPPNIVLFMAEDIGNDLACYGHPGVKTPTLDNLAANGIRYERFYTNSPICSPSRTSLMLGVHQGYSGGHHHRSNVKGPRTTLPNALSAGSGLHLHGGDQHDPFQNIQD